MSHISLTYHIVWRTKRSRNTIREQHERELYAYILGICQSKSSRLHRINSMPDHIHLCVEVSPYDCFKRLCQGIEAGKFQMDEGATRMVPAF